MENYDNLILIGDFNSEMEEEKTWQKNNKRITK